MSSSGNEEQAAKRQKIEHADDSRSEKDDSAESVDKAEPSVAVSSANTKPEIGRDTGPHREDRFLTSRRSERNLEMFSLKIILRKYFIQIQCVCLEKTSNLNDNFFYKIRRAEKREKIEKMLNNCSRSAAAPHLFSCRLTPTSRARKDGRLIGTRMFRYE